MRCETVETENETNKEIHIAKETKVMLNNEAYRFRFDVTGSYGCVLAKGFVNKNQVEFRYEISIKNKDRIKNESLAIVRLLRKGSSRVVRILKHGEINNLKYILTTPTGRNLEDILKEYPKMEPYAYIHIVMQTYQCLRDVHSVNCAHFDVQPSSFCLKKYDSKLIIIKSFHYCISLNDLRHTDKEKLVAKSRQSLTKYSSRRQHKGQRSGPADDLESWFYMIYEIAEDKLPWSSESDLVEMLYKKWMFIKQIHKRNCPSKENERRLITIYDAILSCNLQNYELLDSMIYQEITNWYDLVKKPEKKCPWEV